MVRGGEATRLTVAMATDKDLAGITTDESHAEWPEWEEETKPINRGGRPNIELDGISVGHYLHALMHGERISERIARERLDLRYTGHVRNRDFAREVHDTITELERG
jgi:hypothetical protein